jgi:hypothetical protein
MNNTTSKKTIAGRPNYSARKALPPNDIAAGSAMPPGALPYNAIVHLTNEADSRERARQAALKRDESKARAELSGIYVPRFRPSHPGKFTEEEEEDQPRPIMSHRGPDYEGFTEVKRKSRKIKRELTTAELNAKVMEAPSDDEDGEVNADLYENTRQHEHY